MNRWNFDHIIQVLLVSQLHSLKPEDPQILLLIFWLSPEVDHNIHSIHHDKPQEGDRQTKLTCLQHAGMASLHSLMVCHSTTNSCFESCAHFVVIPPLNGSVYYVLCIRSFHKHKQNLFFVCCCLLQGNTLQHYNIAVGRTAMDGAQFSDQLPHRSVLVMLILLAHYSQ